MDSFPYIFVATAVGKVYKVLLSDDTSDHVNDAIMGLTQPGRDCPIFS